MSTTVPRAHAGAVTSAAGPTATPAGPAADAGAPGRRPRDPWLDSTKMLLVLLVVVGHSWTVLPENAFNARIYDWLYFWHLPAFVVVTGHLSRRFTYSARTLRRLVTQVVVPYLLFEGLLAAFRVAAGGESFELLWLNPHWPMWFLVALFFWRLATPLLRRARAPLALAVALSLASGLFSVDVMDLNRVLGLLPFWVLGMLLEPRHLALVRTRATRLLGLPVLAGAIWLTGVLEHDLQTEWLYYRTSYDALEAGVAEGMLLRLGLLALGVAMGAAALAWVPARDGWFARMGSATMVVYLCHGFVVKAVEYADPTAWALAHPALSFVTVTAGAAALALFLAWRPVSRRLARVVTPLR